MVQVWPNQQKKKKKKRHKNKGIAYLDVGQWQSVQKVELGSPNKSRNEQIINRVFIIKIRSRQCYDPLGLCHSLTSLLLTRQTRYEQSDVKGVFPIEKGKST